MFRKIKRQVFDMKLFLMEHDKIFIIFLIMEYVSIV